MAEADRKLLAALPQLERAVDADPKRVELRNQLGAVLLALNRPGDAVAPLEKALELNHDYVEARYNLATAYHRLDRIADAVVDYKIALAARPDFAEAHNNLGQALKSLRRIDEAVIHFEHAVTLRPTYVMARGNLAKTLTQLGRHDAALEQYRAITELMPKDAEAHSDLGLALQSLDRQPDALIAFERAIDLTPNFAPAHHNRGTALQALNRHEEALAAYEHALALAPNFADGHAHAGHALVELGEIDQAMARYERAIELAPRAVRHYKDMFNFKRVRDGDAHLAALERLAAEIESLSPRERIELQFALGKAYDDLGQHERAFAHLLEGNAMRHAEIDYDEDGTLAALERIGEVFTSELLATKRGHGNPSPAPVFVVGMPRSGTTLIEQIIASHPAAHGAGELRDLYDVVKERAPGFPSSLPEIDGGALRAVGDAYLARVKPLAPRAERVVDKMPSNFRFAGLIHLALPHARIIHARRDPVDTCLSYFSKLFAEEEPYRHDLRELGRYWRAYDALMAHWRRVLPPGAMLEIQYEEVVADIEGQARRIIAYCDLPWSDTCLAFHEAKRPVRTASAAQVRQPAFTTSVGRSRLYGESLRPLLDALGDAAPKP